MIYIWWRMIAFTVWFGVAFALCTVVIVAALVAIIGAIVYGLISPTRTPKTALRSLLANTEAGIAHVKALRPSSAR